MERSGVETLRRMTAVADTAAVQEDDDQDNMEQFVQDDVLNDTTTDTTKTEVDDAVDSLRPPTLS